MDEQKSRVYARVDGQNRITRIEGEYTLPTDLSGWVLIEEGNPCDRLNLAQTHYLPKGLINDEGIYLYKYENGEVLERTEAEIEADRNNIPTPEPTAEEIRFDEIETALTEVAEMSVDNEEAVSNINQQIVEIQDALVELASMITEGA